MILSNCRIGSFWICCCWRLAASHCLWCQEAALSFAPHSIRMKSNIFHSFTFIIFSDVHPNYGSPDDGECRHDSHHQQFEQCCRRQRHVARHWQGWLLWIRVARCWNRPSVCSHSLLVPSFGWRINIPTPLLGYRLNEWMIAANRYQTEWHSRVALSINSIESFKSHARADLTFVTNCDIRPPCAL